MTVTREETQRKIDLMAQGAMAHTPEQSYTVADRFEEWAAKTPDAPFLIDIASGRSVSFDELNRRANQYARLAQSKGLKTGDVAAVMLENRPEFFYAWVGMAKIGVIAALLNTHARGRVFEHSLHTTGASLLLIGEECLDAWRPVSPAIGALAVPDGKAGDLAGLPDIEPLLDEQDDSNPGPSAREGLIGESTLFYVFTSGTTGLPKAAKMSHMRWLVPGDSWQRVTGTDSDDVFYCMLPLFHMAAGMSLTSHALAAGGPIVLRRKFSASRFWDDVRRYGVTTTQYIGEVCRYLVNQPVRDNERDHTLKRMTGAGMSADVWRRFVERFGDIAIYEGYGGTETNVNMTNLDGVIGACGRVPFKDRSNARLVKYDLERDELVRDAGGHVLECEAGEVGELIGMILNIPGVGAGRFEGYTDSVATEKKILRNAFQEGDAWFRTGDLFVRDEDDYFYFVDRIGDTFRWKSENVSTTEVADVLSGYEGAELVNVYGVKVPEHEGRAGMAAVQMREGAAFDGEAFYRVAQELPHYARPLFVRVADQADITPTFKLRKVDLQRQGYNPGNFTDPLYVLDETARAYVPYSKEALQKLGVGPGD